MSVAREARLTAGFFVRINPPRGDPPVVPGRLAVDSGNR